MKIIKIIPNTITSLNLLCGVLGVIFTLEADSNSSYLIQQAFVLLLCASVFDFLDGLTARVLKAYSDIGKELDSLADLISFGLLPAVMLYKIMLLQRYTGEVCPWSCEKVLYYIPLILSVFSALRLAKFNIDEQQHESFIGLATPSSAMICGSLAYYIIENPKSLLGLLAATKLFIPILAIFLSILLVSNIKMFALKFGKDMNTSPIDKLKRMVFFIITGLIVVGVIVLKQNWSIAILITFLCYIIINVLFALTEKIKVIRLKKNF